MSNVQPKKKNSLTANLHVFPISRFDSFEMHLPRRVHSSCKEPSYCHGGHSASIWDAGLIVCSGAAWIFSDSPSKVACPLSVSTYPFRLHVEVPDVREPMRVHSPPLRGHHLWELVPPCSTPDEPIPHSARGFQDRSHGGRVGRRSSIQGLVQMLIRPAHGAILVE